jgi:hypothetical protein
MPYRGIATKIAKRRIEIDNILVYPGEVVLISLEKAIILSSIGFVELLRVKSPS